MADKTLGDKRLGKVLRVYRPDGSRLLRRALIALPIGAAAAYPGVVWTLGALRAADPWWYGVAGGASLVVAVGALAMGASSAGRRFFYQDHMIKVREGGLSFVRGRRSDSVAWDDVTKVVSRVRKGVLPRLVARVFGRELSCRVEIGARRRKVITALIVDADELIRTVERETGVDDKSGESSESEESPTTEEVSASGEAATSADPSEDSAASGESAGPDEATAESASGRGKAQAATPAPSKDASAGGGTSGDRDAAEQMVDSDATTP